MQDPFGRPAGIFQHRLQFVPDRLFDQIVRIDIPERKEKKRIFIEPDPDAV